MKYIIFRILDFLEIILEKKYWKMSQKNKKRALKAWYWLFTRECLDVDNPKNFNEKMQWLKIYDSTKEKESLSDKYLVREWVANKIGEKYLIPLLGSWDSVEDIRFEELPDKFVFKANHGSGMNYIVTNKSEINVSDVRKMLNKWLKTPAGILALEQQYYHISRKIIAEEYIEQLDGDLLDYKFHCFNGVPKFIQVIGNRNNSDHNVKNVKEAYLDLNWNRIEAMHNRYSLYEELPDRPNCLDELLDIAGRLSEGFIYVRVDLYVIGDSIKFGEMTFTPAQGLGKWGRAIPYEWWK